jgi:hypothetical protein
MFLVTEVDSYFIFLFKAHATNLVKYGVECCFISSTNQYWPSYLDSYIMNDFVHETSSNWNLLGYLFRSYFDLYSILNVCSNVFTMILNLFTLHILDILSIMQPLVLQPSFLSFNKIK